MLRFFNSSWLRELRRAATEWHDRRDEMIPDGYTFAEEGTDSSAAWGWIAFPLSILLVLLIWWRFYPHQLRYDFLCLFTRVTLSLFSVYLFASLSCSNCIFLCSGTCTAGSAATGACAVDTGARSASLSVRRCGRRQLR